jgi:hypothetical protein
MAMIPLDSPAKTVLLIDLQVYCAGEAFQAA